MEEQGSRNRFVSLVAGTAADQIAKSNFSTPLRSRQGSEATLETLLSSHESTRSLGMISSKISGEKAVRGGAISGDLIRRSRPDNSRTSLLDGTRFSPPLARHDRDGVEEGFDAHIPHDQTVSASTRLDAARNLQPKGLVKLRTSKSMHQRSENVGSPADPSSMDLIVRPNFLLIHVCSTCLPPAFDDSSPCAS